MRFTPILRICLIIGLCALVSSHADPDFKLAGYGAVSGGGVNIRDYVNVIVRNLTIHEVLYPNDALTLDNVQHGWVDRCELYTG